MVQSFIIAKETRVMMLCLILLLVCSVEAKIEVDRWVMMNNNTHQEFFPFKVFGRDVTGALVKLEVMNLFTNLDFVHHLPRTKHGYTTIVL